jgi:transcription initiation factor TFIIE subunit beta
MFGIFIKFTLISTRFKFYEIFRVEKKLRPESSKSSSASTSKKPAQPWESKPAAPKEPQSYKTMTGSSNKRFAILTKIVNYMKERHLRGEDHPLTIEEILDETNQLDIGSSTKTVSEFLKFLNEI